MRFRLTAYRAALFVVVLCGAADSATAQGNPAGHWVGDATYGGDTLSVELTIEMTPAGWVGFFTAPTLRAFRYPLRNVVFDKAHLNFDLVGDAGAYPFQGEVADANSLVGDWQLFGVKATVFLRRADSPPVPYSTNPVSCRNGDVTLAGTVFVPRSAGPWPAVVFAHGSGGETRDASNFVADQLVRMGVIALAFDKRGAGASSGNWREADFRDLANDVIACVQLLKARKDVVGTKIGLVGASQAGWIAPLAASLSRDIGFLALVSGPAVPVWREGWWETEFRLRQRGFGEAELESARAILRMNDDVTRTGRGLDGLQARLDVVRGEAWFPLLGFTQAPSVEGQFRRFYRRIIDFDPLPLLEQMSVPSLWLFGELDAEMPAAESAAVLEQLRTEGKNITIRTLKNADHALFVVESNQQGFRWPRVTPGYIESLTDWIVDETNR